MPIENLEEQGLEKNPDFDLAQWKFLLETSKYKNASDIKTKMLQSIEANSKKMKITTAIIKITLSRFIICICNRFVWHLFSARYQVSGIRMFDYILDRLTLVFLMLRF